jgi:hypothetical protein
VYPVLCGVRLQWKNLKKSNFSKDQHELPEDGPCGLKQVGAFIQVF